MFTQAKLVLTAGALYTLACLSVQADESAHIDNPIDIGIQRELFVDHFLIDKTAGVRLVLNRPRDEGPVLQFDKPWEGLFCGYCTVIHEDAIHDGPKYRVYYRGMPGIGHTKDNEVTCIANSEDGIHWEKPELGLFEVQGTRKNNVILARHRACHNFAPFLDTNPDAKKSARFKALGGTGKPGLIAFTSPDGVHWTEVQKDPVLTDGAFDSQNVAFWSASEACYLCYFRVFKDGFRRISRSTSKDFIHWSKPVLMQYRHPGGEAPIEHLYTNQTHPYFRAPHLYISTAARFMPGRQVLTDEQARAIHVHPRYFKDTSDSILQTTRGGSFYDRTFLSSFISPGIGATNWVSRSNYPALNVVQTGPAEMSVYVNQDYAQPTAHLQRYSMRLDGFASARAGYPVGTLLTRPIIFSGKQLSINFATSAAGYVRVEFQTPDGTPIAGYNVDDCREQIGNEIERIVTWKAGANLSSLAGTPVRLRFVMKDADLYSFQFQPRNARK